MTTPMPLDNLNEIGVLKHREVEARILMPERRRPQNGPST